MRKNRLKDDKDRRYKQVADTIAQRIYSGDYQVGERLPAERELAESFDIGRPVLREALIALELSGLVQVKQGAGVYVVPWENHLLRVNVFDRGVSPFDLIDARCMIESEVAAEAASIITDRELLGLQHAIQMMKESVTHLSEYEKYDNEFHIRIAKASRNATITSVISSLLELHIQGEIWNHLHEVIPKDKLHGDRLDEHIAIYDALKRRNPDDARQAMINHLQRAKQTLMNAAVVLEKRES